MHKTSSCEASSLAVSVPHLEKGLICAPGSCCSANAASASANGAFGRSRPENESQESRASRGFQKNFMLWEIFWVRPAGVWVGTNKEILSRLVVFVLLHAPLSTQLFTGAEGSLQAAGAGYKSSVTKFPKLQTGSRLRCLKDPAPYSKACGPDYCC